MGMFHQRLILRSARPNCEPNENLIEGRLTNDPQIDARGLSLALLLWLFFWWRGDTSEKGNHGTIKVTSTSMDVDMGTVVVRSRYRWDG